MNKMSEFVNSFFGSIYLTIIALLQGVAIFELTPHLISYLTSTTTQVTAIYTVPLFTTLLVIFIVWHHYVNGILFLRWFPNIIDALIPFAISFSEFILISFLKKEGIPPEMNIHGWTKSFAFFLGAGSIAYFAAAIRNDPKLFSNFMDKKNSEIHGKNIRQFYTQAGISMLLQAIFAVFILIVRREQLLWFSFLFFVMHIIISEYFHIKLILPSFKKGLDEFNQKDN